MFRSFIDSTKGTIATIGAIMLPLFLGVMGLATDYMMFFDQKSKLQEAADAAALASVKELSLAGTNKAKSDQLKEISESYVYSAFFGSAKAPNNGSLLQVDTTPDISNAEVKVKLTYKWAPMFAQLFDKKVTPISVEATARLSGDSLTCVIGLMQPQTFAKSSIHLDNRSVLKADGCSVFSNSVSKYGLRADGKAQMTAQSICTAGGMITFGQADFSPEPITDCPKIEDPLSSRAKPVYGDCNDNDDAFSITEDTVLKPGVYCGGLTIAGNAKVTLEKGIFVIKEGPLIVANNASLIAKEASFFLTGDNSVFDFQAGTTINLSAMETGALAGLLFYEDRDVTHSFEFNPFFLSRLPEQVRLHKISSNDARNLLGTIYLPRSLLLVNAEAPVADASAYTAIIAGRVWLQEGPTLTLNADYTDTKVPVPDGIMGTEPTLVK